MHLWLVVINYQYLDSRLHVNLWFTTRINFIEAAIGKANRFLKTEQGVEKYPLAIIKSIENRGTIDG